MDTPGDAVLRGMSPIDWVHGISGHETKVQTVADEKDTGVGERQTEVKKNRRSRTGCVTCKIRKKRCDEIRPTCGDCRRLKRRCTWAAPDMSSEELKSLKRQVEIEDEDNKTRKRCKKPVTKAPEQLVVVMEHQMSELRSTMDGSSRATGGVDTGTRASPKADIAANADAPAAKIGSPFALSPFLMSLDNCLEYTQNSPESMRHHQSPQIQELDLNGDVISDTDQIEATPAPSTLLYAPSPNIQLLQRLSGTGLKLYDYFRSILGPKISIVPQEENLFLKTFLPMAHQDLGVLYGLLAWSAFHMRMNDEGNAYLEKSLAITSSHKLDVNSIKDDQAANLKIANYLILCGAEICRGDVSNWSYLLQRCAEIIRYKGIRNFNDSKTRHWLVTNFAYHDVMTSSIIERGIQFPLEDYHFVINANKFGLDPLHGLSKPLFQLIGEISNFAMNFSKMLAMTSETLSDNSYKNRYGLLQQMSSTARKLDAEIDQAKPNFSDLYKLCPEDIELQLTLFESFQITAKLHLRQSIMKLSPRSLDIQFLCIELLRCLNIVLGSSVESSLVFPIFILGINLSDALDREWILKKFDEFHQRYQYGNVSRAKDIMLQVWERNMNGERCIDWYAIVKDLGWELSFA